MRKKHKREVRLARMRERFRTMTDAERTLWQHLRQLPDGVTHLAASGYVRLKQGDWLVLFDAVFYAYYYGNSPPASASTSGETGTDSSAIV